jgi:hypothetical protein
MHIPLIYPSVEGSRRRTWELPQNPIYPNVSEQRKLNASGAYYVRTHKSMRRKMDQSRPVWRPFNGRQNTVEYRPYTARYRAYGSYGLRLGRPSMIALSVPWQRSRGVGCAASSHPSWAPPQDQILMPLPACVDPVMGKLPSNFDTLYHQAAIRWGTSSSASSSYPPSASHSQACIIINIITFPLYC